MTLHARWFGDFDEHGEARKAQHPPDPRYPLGVVVDCTEGRPSCSVSLEYPAPCVGKWLIRCDVCHTLSIVTAAGRPDDPHTVRLPCTPQGSA
jgi:hypothetical protein